MSILDEIGGLLEGVPNQDQALKDKVAGQKLVVERLKLVITDLLRTERGLEASILQLDPVVEHGGKTVADLITSLRGLQKMVATQAKIVDKNYVTRFEQHIEDNLKKLDK